MQISVSIAQIADVIVQTEKPIRMPPYKRFPNRQVGPHDWRRWVDVTKRGVLIPPPSNTRSWYAFVDTGHPPCHKNLNVFWPCLLDVKRQRAGKLAL
jgi:hypothetical protein